MVTYNLNSFVLGTDEPPGWFVELGDRIQYVLTDDGQVQKIVVTNSSGPVTAIPGDTIAELRGDVIVIPKKAANKYMKGELK